MNTEEENNTHDSLNNIMENSLSTLTKRNLNFPAANSREKGTKHRNRASLHGIIFAGVFAEKSEYDIGRMAAEEKRIDDGDFLVVCSGAPGSYERTCGAYIQRNQSKRLRRKK